MCERWLRSVNPSEQQKEYYEGELPWSPSNFGLLKQGTRLDNLCQYWLSIVLAEGVLRAIATEPGPPDGPGACMSP